MLFGMRELTMPSFGQDSAEPEPAAKPTPAPASDPSVDSAATSIGPQPDRGQAPAWALVLQSQNIACI
jgi:hypothetical protein